MKTASSLRLGTFNANVPQREAKGSAFIIAADAAPAAGLVYGGLRPAKVAAGLHGGVKVGGEGRFPGHQGLAYGSGATCGVTQALSWACRSLFGTQQ